MTKTQDNSASTSLVSVNEFDDKVALAADQLRALAEEADEDLQEKLYNLATLTQPTIKGIEGNSTAKIPRILIRQASSSSDMVPSSCQLGQLYHSQAGVIGDELTFIPILQHVMRVKWLPESSSPDCMSLDGVTGSRYGKCADCPHGRFDPNTRPSCSKGNKFYVVTEELDAIYQVDFLKSSVKAGRTIIKLTTPPALWARSFTLSTEKHSANSRTYYTFKAQPTGRRTSPNMMAICEALHAGFHGIYQKSLAFQAYYANQFSGSGSGSTIDVTGGQVEISDDEDGSIDFSGSM